MQKQCNTCKHLLNVSNFYKHKSNKDKLSGKCKTCISSYNKNNKDARYANYLKFLKDNPNYKKQYRYDNPKKHEEYAKKHYYNNRAAIIAKDIDRVRHCIDRKLSCYLRNRLYCALKKNYKSGSAVRDLGCSIEELKKYLEAQFQPGMTWDNWGKYGWHIDHIEPLCKFDLTDSEQLKKACHYTNLRPLWAEDNLRKSGHYDK